jgi:hypothetical protein
MKKKISDTWSDVKKFMSSAKKENWMTKEKKKLSKVKPIKKK